MAGPAAAGASCVSPRALAVLRIVLATYATSVVVLLLAVDASSTRFFTTWAFCLLALSLDLLALGGVPQLRQHPQPASEGAGPSSAFARACDRAAAAGARLFPAASGAALFLSLVYFSILYADAQKYIRTPLDLFLDRARHGGNIALAAVEIAAGRVPVPWWHVFWLEALVVLYALFARVYYAVSGEWTYGFLDTSISSWPAAYAMALVTAACCHVPVWAAAFVRDWFAARRGAGYAPVPVELPLSPAEIVGDPL
eukprot:tig00020801_g13975.t1